MTNQQLIQFFVNECELDDSIFPLQQNSKKQELASLQLLKNKYFLSHRIETAPQGKKVLYLYLHAQSKYDMQISRLSYPAIEHVLEKMNEVLAPQKTIDVRAAVKAISSVDTFTWKEEPLQVHIEKGYAYISMDLN